ncbi:MAG: hypothetical protein AAGD96_13015, partial [Chloroflexota bacterium]
MERRNTPKSGIILFIIISIFLLILSACGGASEPDEEAAEEAVGEVEEAVEEQAIEEVEEAEEMMEEEIDIEPEKEIEEPIGAESSESEGGSPYEPQTGTKAQPTRTSAEEFLASVDEVRSIEELPEIVLSAEMLDDNEDWVNYMRYLENYSGPRVQFINILERHLVTFVDPLGRPISGLSVEFLADGQTVGRSVTHADGKLYIFPNALDGLSDSITQLELQLTEISQSFEISLGTSQILEFVVETDALQANSGIDIAIVIDVTGSMADDMGPLLESLATVGSQLRDIGLDDEIRVAFVEYRDDVTEAASQSGQIAVVDFAPLDVGYSSQLSTINPSGGGDSSEMLAEGLSFAIDDLS